MSPTPEAVEQLQVEAMKEFGKHIEKMSSMPDEEFASSLRTMGSEMAEKAQQASGWEAMFNGLLAKLFIESAHRIQVLLPPRR